MSEVTKKKENAVAAVNFEADAGQGLNMTQEDLALPFLKVLGQLSLECNKRDAKHVEGAEPGMIINTVTNEIYDGVKGIDVVPVHYKRQHIEWQDRGESQGAPVKSMKLEMIYRQLQETSLIKIDYQMVIILKTQRVIS